jgi:hypothetical protein
MKAIRELGVWIWDLGGFVRNGFEILF